MRKQIALSGERDWLPNEIRDGDKPVPLSPWTLTYEEVMAWDKEQSDWDRGKRNYGVTDLCDADTPKKLNEASLGHVHWRYLESKAKSFAIIDNHLKIAVKIKNQSVKHLLHKFNKGNYFGLWGHSQKDGPNKIHIIEPYWFVIGIQLNDIRKFVEGHGQCPILYSGPETGGHVKNYANLVMIEDIGPFHPNKIAQFYSKILGRPIVFEVRIPGWVGIYGAFHRGIKGVAGIRKTSELIVKTLRKDSF
ncbi:MAG: hypothetical protein ACP5VS_00090 [Desulfomonilaceae bacterium]